MSESMSLVGLDVHACADACGGARTATGELRGRRLRVAPAEVVAFLEALPGPVRAVYEAGPTGFGLARAATDARDRCAGRRAGVDPEGVG